MKKVAIMKIKENDKLPITDKRYDRKIIGELDYQIYTIGNENFIKIVNFAGINDECLKLLIKYTENRARIHDADSIELRSYNESVPQFIHKLGYKKLANERNYVSIYSKSGLEKYKFNSSLRDVYNNIHGNEKV